MTDHDETMQKEFEAIQKMITSAVREGLLVEVISQFGDFRANGDDVFEAVRCACYEWDL